MPDNGTATEGGTNSGTTPPAEPEFKAITSQDDLNKLISERLERERSKFKDYGDLKAKAARFDEIDAANKTELERASEARAAAERERDQARADALKLRIAAAHGITDADADLFLTGMDEQTLTAQAKRLADREANTRKTGNVVPGEGKNGGGGTAGPSQDFANFLSGQLGR